MSEEVKAASTKVSKSAARKAARKAKRAKRAKRLKARGGRKGKANRRDAVSILREIKKQQRVLERLRTQLQKALANI